MAKIETQILINAAPEKAWLLFMDFKEWPRWNPFLTAIEGVPKTGERLKVTGRLPDGMTMKFRPTVVKADENRDFTWVGSLPIPGLFEGMHSFVFEPEGGKTLFKHSESFRGILPPFMPGMLKKSKAGFEMMNEAFKKLVEETVEQGK
jgi:hypothetical protein